MGHGKDLTRQRLKLFSLFDLGARLSIAHGMPSMAELVDALASGASGH